MSSGDSQDQGYSYRRFQSDDNSEGALYKALLNQSLQMNHSNQNAWSPLVQGLSAYMMMQGNPNMQGSMAYNKALGQSIGAGMDQPQISMPGINVTDLME